METRPHIFLTRGFSLIELMLVLAVLGICLAGGVAALRNGLSTVETRGAAQDWQAVAAWAQVGVLWQGGSTRAAYDSGSLSLSHDHGLCGGDLGRSTAATDVQANVARWRVGGGIAVTFGGSLASPDGGGSLHFQNNGGAYRVVVRPESGLTVRSPAEARP